MFDKCLRSNRNILEHQSAISSAGGPPCRSDTRTAHDTKPMKKDVTVLRNCSAFLRGWICNEEPVLLAWFSTRFYFLPSSRGQCSLSFGFTVSERRAREPVEEACRSSGVSGCLVWFQGETSGVIDRS